MLQYLLQLEYRELGDEKRRHQKEEGSILGKVDRRFRYLSEEVLARYCRVADLDLILTWPTIAYGIHQSLSTTDSNNIVMGKCDSK